MSESVFGQITVTNQIMRISIFDADITFDVLKYFKGSTKYESALFSTKNYGPVLTSYLNCFCTLLIISKKTHLIDNFLFLLYYS